MSGLLLAALLIFNISAGAAPIDKNADANDVALHGYDPVAYFKAGAPKRGKADITAVHDGVIYRFALVANRFDWQSAEASGRDNTYHRCRCGQPTRCRSGCRPR